jgi:predicted nicotinamide N-methyase
VDAPAPALAAQRRARLIARIRREFAISQEILQVAGRELAFTRVADPEAVLDEVCRQETLREQGLVPRREPRMPYWAVVWESALGVAEHLAARDGQSPLAGRRVLDLGCGMGLVGAVAAMLGAETTLGDIDTAALLFARLNTLPWAERCTVIRCDWQADALPGAFDLIVGADVLYDLDQWPHIEAFARRRLAPGGVLLLGEPGRPKAELIAEWLEARGWTVSASRAQGGDKDVRIYEALRPARAPRA